MNRARNLALICVSSLFPVLLFLIVDLVIGLSRISPDPSERDAGEMNQKFKNGWYELKPSFDRHVFFFRGKRRHYVKTDEHRYRVGGGDHNCSDACTDLLFLGDSFTFGVHGDWEDTFVGMVQLDSLGNNVINSGNGSYSVTPYNYIYQRYLGTRDREGAHLVVIAVDLSDVQDEASYWTAGDDHPEKQQWNLDFLRENANSNARKDAEYPLKAYLPYTHSIWGYFKYGLLNNDGYLDNRVAFTHKAWRVLDQTYPPEGFLPLGVSGGISKVESGLRELLREIEKYNGEAIFLIYPWPNQMVFEDTHFDWSEFIHSICEEESCNGVIDLFPVMREYKQRHPVVWYNDLYSIGDYHFNSKGNRLIADHVLQFLDTMKRDTTDSQK